MQMVKIQIPDRQERDDAFVELTRHGRIVCLPEDTFIVPEPALDVLRSLNINFREIGRGGHDYAEKAIRDASAAKV
ncbi:hypothetical protein AYO40_02865 [Planctomycetaceae bacterium SCGC AG-212-D15]|nr:hypothetical protein AYO40_02865 [Planctomycetaceae bacterium SCGC AG-212-D15]